MEKISLKLFTVVDICLFHLPWPVLKRNIWLEKKITFSHIEKIFEYSFQKIDKITK